MKEWSIHEIEAIKEKEAKQLAESSELIKDHTVYFVDFGGYFGYSCLVFKNGHSIHYANDYQLHHSNMKKEELKPYYMEKLARILFTEDEMAQPIADYDEYKRKEYFLRNYYIMQVDYLSCFGIRETKEEKAAYNRRKARMHFDPLSFAYVKEKAFVKKHLALFAELQEAKERMTSDYEYQKKAFLAEMFNHEYSINWDADWDTLSAFGNITPKRGEEDSLDDYFEQLGFNEIQRQAYVDARKEYYSLQRTM